MTNEEKELLLDLFNRLPYGVNVLDEIGRTYKLQLGNAYLIDLFYGDVDYMEAESPILPYLRPMSSMTDEEEIEMTQILEEVYDSSFTMDKLVEDVRMQEYIPSKYVDWLNKHHFDYRGLIPKGLALEAPKDMYNIE